MPSWSDFEAAVPDLAAKVRERLDAYTHKTIATIRKDGAPRISGIETTWAEGELWIGSMWQARKALDLLRDPRFALHSGSADPPADPRGWAGDAKLAGRAYEADEPTLRRVAYDEAEEHGQMHLFRLDLTEVSHIGLDEEATKMVIRTWTPQRGVRTIER